MKRFIYDSDGQHRFYLLPNIVFLSLFFLCLAGCNLNDESVSGINGDINQEEIDAGPVDDVDEHYDVDDTAPACSEAAFCDEECVELTDNSDHCGQCGNSCNEWLTCMDSSCRCEVGRTECNDECITVDDDPENCGECGKSCDSGVCQEGECIINPCDAEGAPFGGGDGSGVDPFRLCTPEQLLRIGDDGYNEHEFVLSKDIDFDGLEFDAIGDAEVSFKGTLDGDGRTILNISYGQPSSEYVGLVRYLSGEIRDLNLVGLDLSGKDSVGALVGGNRGIISGVSVEGKITTYGSIVGGLVGHNQSPGVVTESSANIEIVSHLTGTEIGGLVGRNAGTVMDSDALGSIDSNDGPTRVGGLIGLQSGAGDVIGCHAGGPVTIDGDGEEIGGLIGSMIDNSRVELSSASGVVTAASSNSVGGLIGSVMVDPSNDSLAIEIIDSQASADVHGQNSVGGLIGRAGNNPNDTIGIFGGHATGDVAGEQQVGGFLGSGTGPSIERSRADGNVDGHQRVGGFLGSLGYFSVEQSIATGAVSGTGRIAGFGASTGYGTIRDSYATGNVSGDEYVSGFVDSMAYGGVTNCYSTGEVSGEENIHGLSRTAFSAGATSSYWNTTTSGTVDSDLGQGLNNAAFQNESSFEDWDFEDVWEMSTSEQRPLLRWQ